MQRMKRMLIRSSTMYFQLFSQTIFAFSTLQQDITLYLLNKTYSYLDSFRFPPLSIFGSRNTYFSLFVVFINLWNAPTVRIVVDRRRHLSGNEFPIFALQNKSPLSLQYVRIYKRMRVYLLLWKVAELWICWSGLCTLRSHRSTMSSLEVHLFCVFRA